MLLSFNELFEGTAFANLLYTITFYFKEYDGQIVV